MTYFILFYCIGPLPKHSWVVSPSLVALDPMNGEHTIRHFTRSFGSLLTNLGKVDVEGLGSASRGMGVYHIKQK